MPSDLQWEAYEAAMPSALPGARLTEVVELKHLQFCIAALPGRLGQLGFDAIIAAQALLSGTVCSATVRPLTTPRPRSRLPLATGRPTYRTAPWTLPLATGLCPACPCLLVPWASLPAMLYWGSAALQASLP